MPSLFRQSALKFAEQTFNTKRSNFSTKPNSLNNQLDKITSLVVLCAGGSAISASLFFNCIESHKGNFKSANTLEMIEEGHCLDDIEENISNRSHGM